MNEEHRTYGGHATGNPQAIQLLQPGKTIGKFKLVELLGQGGMGQVWKAIDPGRRDAEQGAKDEGFVVLKFLPDAVRYSPEAVADFKATYRRVQQLHHQHICPLYEIGEVEGIGCFQVMQFLEGITLRQHLRSHNQDPKPESKSRNLSVELEELLALLQPVALALDHAHSKGRIHRDVKPENIIYDPITKEVHLIDFGLAAEIRSSISRYSQQKMTASGTEGYMSPEQWQGQMQDAASDLWGLAVVAWEMLTGNLPFHGDGMALGFAVCQAGLPDLEARFSSLQPVFAQAMAKDRKERYSSCNAFLLALKKANGVRSGDTVQVGSAPAPENAQPARVSESQDDDLAALLERTKASVARKQAQAKSYFKDARFAEAASLLAEIPEHLRDSELYETSTQRRDRVDDLDAQIRAAVAEVRLDGIRERITELLQLQPHRQDMQRLAEHLKKESQLSLEIRAAEIGLDLASSGKRLDAPDLEQTSRKKLSNEQLSKVVDRARTALARPDALVAPFDSEQALAAQQAWAKHLGKEVEISNSLGMRFRLIPPGTFDMGSPGSEAGRSKEEHLHRVTLTKAAWMGVFPVTQSEWRSVFGKNPSRFQKVSGEDSRIFPVDSVRWKDCQEFVDKLNSGFALKNLRCRLPTEAEWEYACRAGTTTPFSFGKELNGTQANCDGRYPYPDATDKGPYLDRPCSVGSFAANGFGLNDMHGNVWEWCQDWYSSKYYTESPADDPLGPTKGSSRVLRGGSWDDIAVGCRSAYRSNDDATYCLFSIGCRILLELF